MKSNKLSRELTMSKFKVGDRVVIRESSIFYGTGKENPTNDVEGEVFIVSSDLDIEVNWDNGTYNYYPSCDLELAPSQVSSLGKTPHVHAKEIKAWADGEEIEMYDAEYTEWIADSDPTWCKGNHYRVKPSEEVLAMEQKLESDLVEFRKKHNL